MIYISNVHVLVIEVALCMYAHDAALNKLCLTLEASPFLLFASYVRHRSHVIHCCRVSSFPVWLTECRSSLRGLLHYFAWRRCELRARRVWRVDMERQGSLDYDLRSQNRQLFFSKSKMRVLQRGHAFLANNSPHACMPKVPFCNVYSSLIFVIYLELCLWHFLHFRCVSQFSMQSLEYRWTSSLESSSTPNFQCILQCRE